jgi:hypothetical protein
MGLENTRMDKFGNLYVPKIENGSKIIIGVEPHQLTITINKHFNWFQKKMIKWCFGFVVRDYSGYLGD